MKGQTDMYKSDIYKFVEKIKRRYMTNDPFEIARQCNITVIHRKFGNMKGMYTVTKNCPFIFINDALDEYMENVVLFHELGHHFMHKHYAVSTFKEHTLYDMSSKLEIEANVFAANFIISDSDVEQNTYYQYTGEQLARQLCVPHDLLLIKIMDMNSRGYDFNICSNPRSDFLGK